MARLDPEASGFYDHLYEAARAGCLESLCASGCDGDEAEEVFDRVLLRVIDEVDPIERHFDPPQMVNYLKRSCRNQLISDRRHQGALDVTYLDGADPMGDPGAAGVDQEVAIHLTMNEIRLALRSLPERDRVIFYRRNLLGWSPEEIRRSVGVSERTYRKLLERANKAVRARIEASDGR
jgi:RNA polymerase sigma factor (sigma-70 family)